MSDYTRLNYVDDGTSLMLPPQKNEKGLTVYTSSSGTRATAKYLPNVCSLLGTYDDSYLNLCLVFIRVAISLRVHDSMRSCPLESALGVHL